MKAQRLLFMPFVVAAMAASPSADSPTLMTERGKLLFSDDLATTKEWKLAKGKWESKDGGVVGSEVTADKHAAGMRRAEKFKDAVIQFSFKFDGAKGITLTLNTAKAHLNRLVLNPAYIRVQKDDTDRDGPDKVAVIQTKKTPVVAGEWHTVVLELKGKDMLASLDGKHVVFGANDAIDVEKASFGLTVAGESASFKDFRVWEALPKAEWEKTKAKLSAELTKSASVK